MNDQAGYMPGILLNVLELTSFYLVLGFVNVFFKLMPSQHTRAELSFSPRHFFVFFLVRKMCSHASIKIFVYAR